MSKVHKLMLGDRRVDRVLFGGRRVAFIETPTPRRTINVILVAGQSNSDGRVATTSPNTPAFLSGNTVPGVEVWTGSEIRPYLLYDIGPNGNGTSFATHVTNPSSLNKFSWNQVATYRINEAIGNVVVCQVTEGWTALAPRNNYARGSWTPPPEPPPVNTPHLLTALEQRFAALNAHCAAHKININVLCMLWQQGAADYELPDGPSGYALRWGRLIERVRSFTNTPRLPIFCGTIPSHSISYNEQIAAAQLHSQLIYENVWCRDNNDTTFFDTLHYDAASSVMFGEWAAQKFLTEAI